jgi:hypothetical protein
MNSVTTILRIAFLLSRGRLRRAAPHYPHERGRPGSTPGQNLFACDLASRVTPAATVTAVRAEPGGVGYLALSDSSIVADFGNGRPPRVITDHHRAAAADPDAARRATVGTLSGADLRGVALLSDGATRITDLYRVLTWPAVMGVIRDHGPAALIGQVRAAEDTDPHCRRWPRGKPRDDATVVYWQHR